MKILKTRITVSVEWKPCLHTTKPYSGVGTKRHLEKSLHPTLSGREKEKVPSGPMPHETRLPPHDPFQFIQINESHAENFETRAQKLWRDSTEQFDGRGTTSRKEPSKDTQQSQGRSHL